MITHKTKWLLVGLVCLALWPPAAYGQSSELVDAYYRAGALYAEGHYQEALPFAQEALRLSEREYGPDHPATATMLTTLAKIYHAQDKYAEAEPLFERALAIREVSGSYPGLARSLNNMAQLCFEQGRYAEAEPLIKRSLAIREKALGSELCCRGSQQPGGGLRAPGQVCRCRAALPAVFGDVREDPWAGR